MTEDGWITKAQAAERLAVDERTIERRARAGRITSKARLGFPTLYLATDVEILRQTASGEVRTGILEAVPPASSNGHGAVAHRPDGIVVPDGLLTQVLHAFLHALTHPPPGPTGPTHGSDRSDSAYVEKPEALAITGVSEDELRKAVQAGEVKRRGRRYRRKDLEAL